MNSRKDEALGTAEMAQLVKCLSQKHEDLPSAYQYPCISILYISREASLKKKFKNKTKPNKSNYNNQVCFYLLSVCQGDI